MISKENQISLLDFLDKVCDQELEVWMQAVRDEEEFNRWLLDEWHAMYQKYVQELEKSK